LIIRRSFGLTPLQGMGAASNRSSWVIYNNSANTIYWAYSRDGCSAASGFPILSGGFFGLKIPEDDPTLEVWIVAAGAGSDIAIYQGFRRQD